jgi:hypothetical protein
MYKYPLTYDSSVLKSSHMFQYMMLVTVTPSVSLPLILLFFSLREKTKKLILTQNSWSWEIPVYWTGTVQFLFMNSEVQCLRWTRLKFCVPYRKLWIYILKQAMTNTIATASFPCYLHKQNGETCIMKGKSYHELWFRLKNMLVWL